MLLSDWLDRHTSQAPRALSARVREFALKADGSTRALTLATAGQAALERVLSHAGDRSAAHLGYTCGRPVPVYEAWLAPWKLLSTRRRTIEPGYPRADVGTYMLFAGPGCK